MRTGIERYKCDDCKKEHSVDYPIAESVAEYDGIISRLPRTFYKNEHGECRKMVRCGIDGCNKENGEPILARSLITESFK